MNPPPNTPVTSPKTYVDNANLVPEAYCPVEDIVHTINEIIRERREIFEILSVASMEYLLCIQSRKFKRIK